MPKIRFKLLSLPLTKASGLIRQRTVREATQLSLLMCGALLASVICSDATNFMTFRDGANGYAGTQDTFLAAYATTADNSSATTIEIDGPPESEEAHLLLRFDNIFGSGTNQIPARSKILYASLTIQITNTGDEPKMHRMLVPWT